MIEIELPIKPISINAAFKGRRFKTAECKRFDRQICLILPRHAMIMGKVEVLYRFHLKNHALADWDNAVKVMQDNLVKCGYIEDDRKIYRATVEKIPAKEDKIEIKIWSMA